MKRMSTHALTDSEVGERFEANGTSDSGVGAHGPKRVDADSFARSAMWRVCVMHVGQHVDVRQLSVLERAKGKSVATASAKYAKADAGEECEHGGDDGKSS